MGAWHAPACRLGPLLREFLHQHLPEDAHERCSGTTHVATTRALPIWRPQTISHFHSRGEEARAALPASPSVAQQPAREEGPHFGYQVAGFTRTLNPP